MFDCAPGQLKNFKINGSCFSLSTLQKLAYAYNKHFEDKILNIEAMSYQQLRDTLDTKLSTACSNDSCRAEAVGLDNDPAVNKELRPKTPKTWLSNPVTWLTNFNIEAVMIQYEALYPDFKFLGVFPVDFSFSGKQKTCLYQEMCAVNLSDLKCKYVGFIINLDVHTGSGTHWTAVFMDIQPSSKWFGMYYYDSISNSAPKEMVEYYNMLKKTLPVKDQAKFLFRENKVRHQTGHTECGVFSMYFIIKWLTYIHKYPEKTSFEVIVKDEAIRDKHIVKLRKLLFRPINDFKKRM
jgi:hypothetical protein